MGSKVFSGILVAIGAAIVVAVGLSYHQQTAPPPTAAKVVFKTDPDAPTPDSLQPAVAADVRSPWFDAERKRYSALVDGTNCDTLVVPFQSQHLGFDRATRSIMTAQLALALARDGRCVVDPYVASEALGEGLRRLDANAVDELARVVHAKTVVTTYVGHDGHHHLEVFASVQKPDPLPYRTVAHQRWDGIEFSDEVPPFVAWQSKLPGIIAALGLGDAVTPAATPSAPAPAAPFELPDTAEKLVAGAPVDMLDAARRYELLAMLGPTPSFRGTEHLFEKAWLAASMAPESAESRRIRARALMHLDERPAALAVLGSDSDATAQVLRELLNGNMPEVLAALPSIPAPAEKLMSEFDARDMRFANGRGTPGQPMPAVAQAKQAQSPSWAVLLRTRAGEYDGWQVDDNVDLKRVLDALYPIAGFSVEDIARGAAALGASPAKDLALSAKRHIDRLLAQQPRRFCCTSFALDPNELDFLQLLSARSLGTLEKAFRFEQLTQGRIDAALALADAYDAEYAGHPHLAALRATALAQRAQARPGDVNPNDQRLAMADADVAVYFEQQGTFYSAGAWRVLGRPQGRPDFAKAYGSDFPPNSTWAKAIDRLPYAQNYPGVEMQAEAPDALLAALQTRFHGSLGAAEFAALKAAPPGQRSDTAALRAQIQSDPEGWAPYPTLVSALIAEGDAEGAAKVGESYPGFSSQASGNGVELSNQSADIGHRLFWYGWLDLARPFYARSAGYRTGSDASLLSEQRIAILDGDYATAAGVAQQRYGRYQSAWALYDYLRMSFAFGLAKDTWPAFMANADQPELPEFWLAALVGKRVEGASDADVATWYSSDPVRAMDANWDSTHISGRTPAVRSALTYFLIDRAPFDGLPALLSRIEGAPTIRVDSTRTVMRPIPGSRSSMPIQRSAFHKDAHEASSDEALPSHYVLFGPAYLALRKGDYPAAVAAFDRYARYNAIEGDWYDLNTSTALPYFAFAAAKSGDTLKLRAFIEALPAASFNNGTDADAMFARHLALAYFTGLAGEHDAALAHLEQARRDEATTWTTHGLNSYLYAEACIWLFDETHDARYRDRALEWARANQRMEPTMAWSYALEAAYGDAKDASHTRAIALAAYLDRHSYWLSKVPAPDVERARAWLAKNSPFRLPSGRRTRG